MVYRQFNPTYTQGQEVPFKVSRSKIDLFIECPRCFWLDRVKGIKRPDTPPFQINKAIDELLKKEFNIYREKGEPHPWMKEIGLDAVPFQHEKLEQWRHNFTGVQALHKATNLLVFGAVDDIWVTPKKELIVVDYKATAKKKEITDLDPPGGWHDAYRRQMEVYQWLLRQNGFTVSNTGYFVYANGIDDKEGFFNTVEFRTHTFAYTGSSEWVDSTLIDIKATLEMQDMPAHKKSCTYCQYTADRLRLSLAYLQKNKK